MIREFIDKKIKELEDRLFDRLSKEVEEYLVTKMEAEIKEMFSHLETDIQEIVKSVLANPTQIINQSVSPSYLQNALQNIKL